MADWGPGHVIAGRYRLIGKLGQGGMGSVWRAEHLSLSSPVAIKLLDPAIAGAPEMLERFLREAQSAAALRSMHVVQIFDHGVEADVPYIAMELMNGESVRDRLDRVGRLPAADTIRFMTHVARAVGKAHEAGIVHRDLKPDNVFLVKEEEEIAKVLDFGIAKVTGNVLSESGNVATRTGTLLGTPYYMSPEQAQGNKTVDHRTDLWAMAVITYECMTGVRPFDSDGLGDLVLKICTGIPAAPSSIAEVPPGFDPWFARATQKDPELRFQSARELVEALARAAGGAGAIDVASGSYPGTAETLASGAVFATTTGGTAAPSAASRSNWPSPVWLAVGTVVALVAGVGTWLAVTSGADPPGDAQLEPDDTSANVSAAAPTTKVEEAAPTTPSAAPAPSAAKPESQPDTTHAEPTTPADPVAARPPRRGPTPPPRRAAAPATKTTSPRRAAPSPATTKESSSETSPAPPAARAGGAGLFDDRK